jgi:hypothetical protein
VSSLFFNNGNDALDINVADPQSQILASFGGHGLLAVYEPAVAPVPEPGTLALFVGGAALVLGSRLRMRRRNPQ